jgi:hypothetical protein
MVAFNNDLYTETCCKRSNISGDIQADNSQTINNKTLAAFFSAPRPTARQLS